MNGAVDGECNSDQHSNGIVIPSVNSEEKIPSPVADFPLDGEKPFSDDIFQVQSYIPSNEGGWIYQILLCLDALEITELMKSVFSAMTSIIKKVRVLYVIIFLKLVQN